MTLIRVLAAVVRDGDRYLICQRPQHKRHGGLWEFPGGKFEAGETVLDAARRELREELGIEVSGVGELLLAAQDAGSQFVIEFYPVDVVGDPQPIEHSDLRWLSLRAMLELPLAPSDRRFVDSLMGVA